MPLLVASAAGSFALATMLRPRSAGATTTIATAPRSEPAPSLAPPRFTLDLGRPVPAGVRAIVSSGWARPRTNRLHRALDIGVPTGTPVLAVDRGTVTRVERRDVGEAGLWIAVRHPSGITSRYIHLSRTLVDVGEVVGRGQILGHSGNTGNSRSPHLHLDLRAPGALLPAIERVAGRPRSGWGPDMPPFGHSIPGEPWIPVDGHRPIVIADAAAMGIPLRAPGPPRNGARNAALTYRPVGARGEPYPEWLRRIKGSSGVYVIRERDQRGEPVTVYVGESHSARLYETLTRHFQDWRRAKAFWQDQYGENHDPGLTYDRAGVEVAVRVTPASKAIDEEGRLIRALRPRDNLLGQPDDVPF